MQCRQETLVPSLGWEDALEEKMATHYSILVQRIPWTEEAGGLQSKVHKESDTTEHARTDGRKKQDDNFNSVIIAVKR